MELRDTNPTEEASPKHQVKKQTPWKLVVFCIVFIMVFILFIFYPPAKQLIYQTQRYLQSLGWYGSLALCLITSFVVVPFGIPYSMVQMMFAIMIPQYWLALFLTSISQTLGSSVAYWIMKYVFKEKLAAWAKKQALFRGIDLMLSRSPLKFAVILNITNLPLIIKNYALAIPESVGFDTFTLSSIIGAVFTSAPQIYLFQQAEDLDNLFDHSKSPLSTAVTVCSTILSVGIIIYFAWYTKKIINDVQKEMKALEPIELKGRQEEDDVKIEIVPQDQIVEVDGKLKIEGIVIGNINHVEPSYNQEITQV